MLSVQQAESIILQQVTPLDAIHDREAVGLDRAAGRLLAATLTSPQDFPYWDNSAMDGYAVRAADFSQWTIEQPTVLEVVSEIAAGCVPDRGITAGQAARIFTGAMLPPGADTIVPQENTRREGDRLVVLEPPRPKAWVRAKGAYYQAGAPLLQPGTRLSATDIALLATVQCTAVPVYRRPVISLLSTGNELIPPNQTLQPGQIIDSNQPALAALVAETGAMVKGLGIIRDHRDTLKQAIAQALQTSDVVLSSGGVSVGDYDYIDPILAELGGSLHVRAIAVKPGKPLTFATFPHPDPAVSRRILYFGLPGNPVSAPVGFWRFVQPALRKLAGQPHSWGPIFITAKTQQPLSFDGKRETYIWGQLLITAAGSFEFIPAQGAHSSGNLMNLAGTNGLAVLQGDRPFTVQPGDRVRVMQVGSAILNAAIAVV